VSAFSGSAHAVIAAVHPVIAAAAACALRST